MSPRRSKPPGASRDRAADHDGRSPPVAWAHAPTVLLLATAALALSAPPAVAAEQLHLTCAQRSIGEFGTGFGHPANLTAGPLALIGAGSPAPERVVDELGGTKFPAVVRAPRCVRLRIAVGGHRVVHRRIALGRPCAS